MHSAMLHQMDLAAGLDSDSADTCVASHRISNAARRRQRQDTQSTIKATKSISIAKYSILDTLSIEKTSIIDSFSIAKSEFCILYSIAKTVISIIEQGALHV